MINEKKEIANALIEKMILKSIPIEDILSSINFQFAWTNPSAPLINYIMKNIVILFEFSIQSKRCPQSVVNNCILIFQTTDKNILNKIISHEELKKYIHTFSSSVSNYCPQTQNLFFERITYLVSNSTFYFFKNIDFPTLMQSLLNYVYLDPAFRFISSMILNHYSIFYFRFEKFEFPKKLLNEFLKHTKNSEQSILLFIYCLEESNFSKDAANQIISENLHFQVLSKSFNENDEKCVDLLKVFYIQSMRHTNDLSWKQISNFIFDNFDVICSKLVKMKIFGKYEKSVSILYLMISDDRKIINNEAIQVIHKGIELFFIFQTNSFLHSFVVSSIELFIQNKGQVKQLLSDSFLVSMIIQKYQERKRNDVIYRGHLRLISFMIDQFVDPILFPLWKTVVMKENIETQQIIDQSVEDYQKIATLVNVPYDDHLSELLFSQRLGKFVLYFALLALTFLGIIFLLF
ncbi:hypothetical protein TRFO_06012 [Tritrichomonas foetus]|uniref:Uncharacterized protein n=1 Tax=Tritrichomonas foetus TaxID=1144522 RepID=A0A1J4K5T1_9EUKA|nr:hypothetical protein TRFO_06012 [Tritrichomonas foetus]|eukprot:OHT05038.1 hypothetical protein TRFO_06012 [Tritrichomonas foetus]